MDDARSPADITRLLKLWSDGDRDAMDQLMPLVYDELHALASRQLAREWRHGRLHATTVVNEAYLKLFGQREVDWQNRGHFFAIAAQLMRRILVDHARHALRDKRGAGAIHVGLDAAASTPAPRGLEVVDTLALDGALQELERMDPMQGQIVELRFFAGLTVDEAAAALRVSPATIKREWTIAKSWLHRKLSGADPAPVS
jgi:RNA polymerase sigma factor (TIGR02999 family)